MLTAIFAAYCIVAALLSPARAGCVAGSTCIRPVPSPAPPSLSMSDTLKTIRCHMACISEQNIDIQLLNQNTVWPSFAYSQLSCASQQKVDQCTLGCMSRHRSPELTVNRCRDECVSVCEETSSAESGQGCDGACRRTFCRFGCSMHEPLQSQLSTTIPVPVFAPVINNHVDSSSSRKLFMVNISNAMPTQGMIEEPHQNISYLYRVESDSNTSYVWQKDLTLPLDLSAFACEDIQVSFAVVTRNSFSEFSPVQSLCVDGVGGWPSNVDVSTVSVSYTEDSREQYLGYSVANISWERPSDVQYVTSYTVCIFTRTQSCGGLNRVNIYNNIGKDSAWVQISAQDLNGILMFGCSYTLSVVTMPEEPNRSKLTLNIAPELIEEDPEIILDCRRAWDVRGFMNISVNWSLSTPSPLPAIRRFSVVPLLIDSTRSGLFGRLYEYPRHRITTEEDELNYTVILTDLQPQSIQHYKYQIEVRIERGSQYLWRHVPRTVTCTVSTESEPPCTMARPNISLIETQRDEGETSLSFDIAWSPPSIVNGALTEYELALSSLESGSTPALYQSTYPGNLLSAAVNASLLLNASIHCLYATMRSSNGYVWSEWSASEVVPLDQECLSTNTSSLEDERGSSMEDERVTIFYQRAEQEVVRLAEISCSSGLTPTPDTITNTLANLEQKLNSLPNITRVQSSTDSLVERLKNLELKLDQVIDTLSQNETLSK